MIWEPFVLALVLGLIISAGLYFAYLWPSVEPVETGSDGTAGAAPLAGSGDAPADPAASASVAPATPPPDAASPAP